MEKYKVPTKEQVKDKNKETLDELNNKLGFTPNLYQTMALSNIALENYLDFNNAEMSLNAKEKEVVNLTVSQINGCTYCQSAHSKIAEQTGFNKDHIMEIRSGEVSFDKKLDALARFTKSVVQNRGKVNDSIIENFQNAGYTQEHVVDTIALIGNITVSNYMHNVIDYPIDFPKAQPLEEAIA